MGTVDYRVPVAIAGGDVSFHGGVSYASSIYHNIRNFDAQRFAGRTLVDVSATWESADSGLTLTVFGKNIFDKRYGQIGFDNTVGGGANQISFGPPASYGVTLGYRF